MSRFDSPSASFKLDFLLKQRRHVLWCGLVLATGVHLALTQLGGSGQQVKATRPLTTQFVKRQPRLTKPLEMKKRPRPKRRQIRREMVSVKARASRKKMSWHSGLPQAVRGLARPSVAVSRGIGLDQTEVEPPVVARVIESSKEARDVVEMSLEMVDVEALDTGRYQAMIIQDPTDRRSIKGYLHLVLVHVLSVTELARTNIRRTDQGIKRLIESLNELTDIKADVTISADFTSPVALKTPWIYVTSHRPFELTPAETQAVGKYVTHGGFLFCDEHIWVTYATYVSVPKAFLMMIAQGCETQGLVEGRDWYAGKVSSDHDLFHCYFDFDSPPMGYNWPMSDYPIYTEEPMIGVFVNDTLVSIIARRSYAAPWFGKGWSGSGTEQLATRVRALQFGINTIIYALTREGSITNRVMDMIR